MHCVAGDGIGILLAATVTALLKLPMGLDLIAEYVAGFLFAWTIFQALFMKDMVGGSYRQSLRATTRPFRKKWGGASAKRPFSVR
jgi:manganese oxidase